MFDTLYSIVYSLNEPFVTGMEKGYSRAVANKNIGNAPCGLIWLAKIEVSQETMKYNLKKTVIQRKRIGQFVVANFETKGFYTK